MSTLFLLFLLCACGLTPTYLGSSNKQPIQHSLKEIKIQTIPDREGQILRNYLLDNLSYTSQNQTKNYKYDLRTIIVKKTDNLGQKQDGTATRERIVYEAQYTLYDLSTGRSLASFKSSSSLYFNLVSEQFSILTARDSNEKKTLKGLSNAMITRLSLYFKNQENENSAKRH